MPKRLKNALISRPVAKVVACGQIKNCRAFGKPVNSLQTHDGITILPLRIDLIWQQTRGLCARFAAATWGTYTMATKGITRIQENRNSISLRIFPKRNSRSSRR